MRVVVVGGGLGGLASAARLAKLGHTVTLLERADHLGGACSRIEEEGFCWDAGPTTTLLPAVLRDLFRKTGRPLERELTLAPLEVLREHRFPDGTSLGLPGGSRAAQRAALEELGTGLGDAWCAHVDSYAEVFQQVRRDLLERPYSPEMADEATSAMLRRRETLHRRLRRSFRDERLRLLAAHPFVAAGHEPRNVPAWQGFLGYVEQTFGAWTVPGGMAGLTDALTARLATRGVTVHPRTEAHDLVLRSGRVVGVATATGTVDADTVVCAVDPRRLPALAAHVHHTMPAMPPVVTHVGLDGDPPALAGETVLHGDPLLVVRPGGSAPAGHTAWTVHGRGRLAEDVLRALARRGLDVREQVVARVDRSPRTLVDEWGGSPHGVRWQGRGTRQRQLGPDTPVPGVYAAGAHTATGSGIPFVGLSAALVAERIGPA